MSTVIAVFVGGGLGSLARFGVSKATLALFGGVLFPLGTLLANVLSCLVVALVAGAGTSFFDPVPVLRPALLIGFCGGFSTFSTFSFETFELMRNGHALIAVANVLISVLLCLGVLYWLLKQQG